jgi:hypothetical protein
MKKKKSKRPERFEFKRGQTLILVEDRFNQEKNGAERHILGEWDIIKVYRKSVLLQNWPSYEQRLIKFW